MPYFGTACEKLGPSSPSRPEILSGRSPSETRIFDLRTLVHTRAFKALESVVRDENRVLRHRNAKMFQGDEFLPLARLGLLLFALHVR